MKNWNWVNLIIILFDIYLYARAQETKKQNA